jgi:hypothetical protein
MGRKRKAALPWCYYCGREFADERVLEKHQRAKHFRCGSCDKQCASLPAMRQHALKAHGENVLKARNNTQRLAAASNAVDDAPRVRRCRTRARTARAAR